MEFRDYYAIMGVPRDATAEQIKQAYRKLARKFHPDVSKEANAEQQFKDVGEAYEVLRDPQKRAAYAPLGAGPRPGEEFGGMVSWIGPSGVGASTLAPSAASQGVRFRLT